MHERYHVDLSEPGLLNRPSRWLRVRILGLLSVESRLYSVMASPAKDGGEPCQ
jgi:hypothetical protein